MNRFYSTVLGEDHDYVNNFDKISQRKVKIYAIAVLIPTVIWLISGFLMSYIVMKNGLAISIVAAIILSVIIYSIEKIIVATSGKSPVIIIFRVLLICVTAFLGSIALDEVIFEKEINVALEQMPVNYKDTTLENNFKTSQYEIALLTKEVNNLEKKVEVLNSIYNTEMEGKGSPRAGNGPIAKAKKETLDKSVNELKTLKENLTTKQSLLKVDKDNYYETLKKRKNESIIFRMRALWNLIRNDWISGIIFISFTLFFFLLEAVVIIIKFTSNDSPMEIIEERASSIVDDKVNGRNEYPIPERIAELIKNNHDSDKRFKDRTQPPM